MKTRGFFWGDFWDDTSYPVSLENNGTARQGGKLGRRKTSIEERTEALADKALADLRVVLVGEEVPVLDNKVPHSRELFFVHHPLLLCPFGASVERTVGEKGLGGRAGGGGDQVLDSVRARRVDRHEPKAGQARTGLSDVSKVPLGTS